MNTFEQDNDFAERYTKAMEVTLSRLLLGKVIRESKFTSDFKCIDGPNKDKTIEAKFRRSWYGDFLIELKNTYLDTNETYPGWFYTQLNGDYFVYVVPCVNKVILLECSELKQIPVDKGEVKSSTTLKKGRKHKTDNMPIKLDLLKKKCPSYKETHIGA